MLEENAEAVARVSKTFGQNGELALSLYDTFPQEYELSEPLFVIIDKLAVPLFCNRFQRRGQNGAIVGFEDLDTERRASELAGEGLIYLEDLVGYRIHLASNKGQAASAPSSDPSKTPEEDYIEAFIDGENPLFKAQIGGREVLIPAVDEFITDIDEEQRTIEFDLPEGLLELYQ